MKEEPISKLLIKKLTIMVSMCGGGLYLKINFMKLKIVLVFFTEVPPNLFINDYLLMDA